MQGFVPPGPPISPTDGMWFMGLGIIGLVYSVIRTVKKMRGHTLKKGEIYKTVLFVAVSLFIVVMGAQAIVTASR